MSYQVLREDVEVPGEAVTATPKGYMYVPAGQVQQTGTAVQVVATQPATLPQVAVVEPKPKAKPAMLIFSIVLTIICGMHLCLPAFVCLTPALVFAIVGYSLSDSTSREQKSTAKAFHGVSLCCNIASIVYYVLAAIALIVVLGIHLAYIRRDYDYEWQGGCYEDCSHHYHSGYDYEYDDGCPTICVN